MMIVKWGRDLLTFFCLSGIKYPLFSHHSYQLFSITDGLYAGGHSPEIFFLSPGLVGLSYSNGFSVVCYDFPTAFTFNSYSCFSSFAFFPFSLPPYIKVVFHFIDIFDTIICSFIKCVSFISLWWCNSKFMYLYII